VTVVEREIHAVVFERHRVIHFGGLDDLQVLDADFEPAGDAGRALILAHRARDDHRRFLRQFGDGLEEFGRQVAFEGDALDEARAIAHEQKDQLALIRAVVDPALEDDVLPDVV
jgi:hypothetical protein